jgi:CHAT domain-containing protein
MAANRRQFILQTAALAPPFLCAAASASARLQSSRPASKPVLVEYQMDQPKLTISITQGLRTLLVAVDGEEIMALSEKYRRLICRLSTGAERQQLNALAQQLYVRLWRPVGSFALPGSTIFIRRDGILNDLPFESLLDDGTFLGQRFKVRYLARSAASKVAPTSPSPPLTSGRALIYAPINRRGLEVRKLDSANLEVRQIPLMLKSVRWTVRTGRHANKEEYFRDVSEPFSVLHIATHGMTNPATGATDLVFRKPPSEGATGRTGIELLSTAEVRRTHLKGRLVVLAACDSGLESIRAMNDMESIGEAFLSAGVVEVIAARWKIDDLATLTFMESFYQSLGRGRDTASALRAARASMIQSSYLPFQHPHFWSPFLSLTSTVFP